MEVYRKIAERFDCRRNGCGRAADVLAAARHPGVVELIGLEGSTERPVLVTVLVDGPTLAVPMPLTPAEVAGLVGLRWPRPWPTCTTWASCTGRSSPNTSS